MAPTTTRETVLTRIQDLFETHQLHGVWLPEVKLTLAKPDSSNPGAIYLRNAEGTYLALPPGRIAREENHRWYG